MVEQVFSDKTGTLTCNVMDFRKCSINGVSYGLGTTEIGKAYARRMNLPIPDDPVKDPNDPVTPHVNFSDPELKAALQNKASPEGEAIGEFFLHLALNPEVIPEEVAGTLVYSASNPDEAALVYAARHFGKVFTSNELNQMVVTVRERMTDLFHNRMPGDERARVTPLSGGRRGTQIRAASELTVFERSQALIGDRTAPERQDCAVLQGRR